MFEVFIESMSTARSVLHHSTPHAATAAAAAALLRFIPFRFMPVRSLSLSCCHFVNWANICTTLLSALQMDCPSDRSFLASPRLLRAVYTAIYI